jgi:hypothetical protein
VPFWRYAWLYHDEEHGLRQFQVLIEASRQFERNKSLAAFKNSIQPMKTSREKPSIYNRWRFGYSNLGQGGVDSFTTSVTKIEVHRSLLAAAIALKRYELKYHRKPTSLESMVPEFLSSVPIDFFDGKKLRYRLREDGNWVLYSVGADGVDNGGDPTAKEPALKGIWSGRDAVWPQPASEEESRIYETEKPIKRK